MPYSPEHKVKTRNLILDSARRLFSTQGFDAVTVNDIMADCALTRGGFYAHFSSKAELYREALKYSATNSDIVKTKPQKLSTKEWLGKLLDVYLSVDHVNGIEPCPLTFLSTDIASRDQITKETYSNIYKNLNNIIFKYAGRNCRCSKEDVIALTSMMIGAVAVARTIDDESLVKKILSSCRQQARVILDGV